MKKVMVALLVLLLGSMALYAAPASASRAARSCTLTAYYPVGPTNGLEWSHEFGYWYTQGVLHAGNCGAVWTIHLGVNGASQISGQAGRFRLRTYDDYPNIHATFPWTGCHNQFDRFDVRATASGDITPGRGFRVYFENCNPFYDSAGYRPGFQLNAGMGL